MEMSTYWIAEISREGKLFSSANFINGTESMGNANTSDSRNKWEGKLFSSANFIKLFSSANFMKLFSSANFMKLFSSANFMKLFLSS